MRRRADVFADGHDVLAAALLVPAARAPRDVARDADGAARQRSLAGARSRSTRVGGYEYTVEGWVDRFATWRHELARRSAPGRTSSSELLEGAALVREAAAAASPAAAERRWLSTRAEALGDVDGRPPSASRRRCRRSCADAMAALRRSRGGDARTTACCGVTVDRERARFGAWYEMFPRSAGPDPDAQRARSRSGGAAARHRGDGLRRALSAADSSDRPQLPQGPNNTLTAGAGRSGSPWAIGSAEGGHTAIEPGLGTLDDFDRFVDDGAAASASRSRSTSPSSARPTIPRSASIRSGSAIGPTARSSTPRTRRRSTRTSTRSTSSPTTGRRCGTSCSDVVAVLDRARRAIFRVDNPHTKPFGFWEWVIARGPARASGRDLPGRGVHPAEGDALPGQGRLHAVVHLLHLAQHEGGARRVLHRADADRACASTCGRTCSPTRPTSCTSTCSTAAGRRSRSGWCWRRRSARPTASTAASSCARTCRSAGQRGVPRLGEVPDPACGLEPARATSPSSIARVNQIRRDASGAAARLRAAVPRHRQPAAARATASARPTAATLLLVVVNLDPHHMQHGFVAAAARRLGAATRQHGYSVHDLLDGRRATSGAATGTTSGSIPGVRLAHILASSHASDTDRRSPLRADAVAQRLPPPTTIRSGTRTRSSTRRTSARSSTATTTASATSPG